jgi:hypothetical protein
VPTGAGQNPLLAVMMLVVGLAAGAVGGFLVGRGSAWDERRQPPAQARAEEAPRAEPAPKDEPAKEAPRAEAPKRDPAPTSKADPAEAKPQPAVPAAPPVEAPKAGPAAPPVLTRDDRDKAALFEFLRKHAQNPANLEILDMTPRVGSTAYPYMHHFAFRCDLIDYTPDKEYRVNEPGYRRLESKPLSRDSGLAHFTADGKVDRVFLDGCQCLWGTRRPGDPGFASPDRP